MRFALPLILLAVASAQPPQSTDFDDLARRASAALERQPPEAAALYRRALALRPAWAEGWFYLGASEYQLKHFTEAREALARAAKLAPTNGAAWAFQGLTEYELSDYPQALAHIQKAEELGLPDNPQFVATVRIHAASIFMRASDFTSAVQQLHPLALMGDKSPAVMEAFGVAALTLSYLPSAIPADKRTLVELAGRAVWSMYAQQWTDADAFFKQLGEQYPKHPGVHYLRGIYFVDRNPDAALPEFQQELTISPSHVMARVQIAILHLRTGEPDKALPPARDAVRIDPANLLAHLALGRSLLAQEKAKPAIEEFEAALKIDASYPHTHFYMAQAYRKMGRDDDARREQSEFVRLKGSGGAAPSAPPPVR